MNSQNFMKTSLNDNCCRIQITHIQRVQIHDIETHLSLIGVHQTTIMTATVVIT